MPDHANSINKFVLIFLSKYSFICILTTTSISLERHGTRCAGQVAAIANNSICSVGVAFNARVGAVRMLDGIITDSLEAQALTFKMDYIDIYSASWGPEDTGYGLEEPGELAKQAFVHGVTKVRNLI